LAFVGFVVDFGFLALGFAVAASVGGVSALAGCSCSPRMNMSFQPVADDEGEQASFLEGSHMCGGTNFR
jgi:hypothetical protein